MGISRLCASDRLLAEKLAQLESGALRAIALSMAQLAVEVAGLEHPVVVQAFAAYAQQPGAAFVSRDMLRMLQRLVEHLHAEELRLEDRMRSPGERDLYDAAYRKYVAADIVQTLISELDDLRRAEDVVYDLTRGIHPGASQVSSLLRAHGCAV